MRVIEVIIDVGVILGIFLSSTNTQIRDSSRMRRELSFQDGKYEQHAAAGGYYKSNRYQGREFQFHYRPKWQWQIQYSRLDLLCARNHEHVDSSSPELGGRTSQLLINTTSITD